MGLRNSIPSFFILLFSTFWSISCTQNPQPNQTLVIIGAKIYSSPSDEALIDGIVIINDGKISAVGNKEDINIPHNSKIIDAAGMVLTAGYWNSHVHFTEEKWQDADHIPADRLNQQLQNMFTAYGFTQVFDIATFEIQNVIAIRNRINNGEILGPQIFTVGTPFTPADGSPYYIAPLKLPEIDSKEGAASHVDKQINSKSDGIKLFAASPNGREIVYMPADVMKEAVAAAHKEGKPVFAHPTDNKGVELAVKGGVDILAHTSPEDREVWNDELLSKMLASDIALIPTLKLFKWDLELNGFDSENHSLLLTAKKQLATYAAAGGQILFGTDVGFMTDYSPVDEYELMAESNMDYLQILASLTTSPASKFGYGDKTGKIAVGMDANMVLLANDPMDDVRAFSDVLFTFRNGQILYDSKRN